MTTDNTSIFLLNYSDVQEQFNGMIVVDNNPMFIGHRFFVERLQEGKHTSIDIVRPFHVDPTKLGCIRKYTPTYRTEGISISSAPMLVVEKQWLIVPEVHWKQCWGSTMNTAVGTKCWCAINQDHHSFDKFKIEYLTK